MSKPWDEELEIRRQRRRRERRERIATALAAGFLASEEPGFRSTNGLLWAEGVLRRTDALIAALDADNGESDERSK